MLKNAPKDLKIEIEKLTGFYRGIVEDNNDPLKAGRVRVRIHGLHSPKKIKKELDGIPTNELPWAEPVMPIHEGSVSGFGVWSIPVQGSQVMVFFESNNPMKPMYFGSMPGIPESKEAYSNKTSVVESNIIGFKDPKGEYPTSQRLGEPDVHRLARGRSTGTLVETKDDNRDISVPTALGGSWSEPSSPYNAVYPHNYVINTHGGITIELDSTPNAARINIYHPSNSFIEIDNDGNMVVKNNAEKYEIVTQGKNIHIKQQRNLTIDGDHKRKVDGDEIIEIGGNKTEQVDGNKTKTIGGNLDITVTGTSTLTAPRINLVGPVYIAGFLSVDGDGSGEGGVMTGTFRLNGNLIITGGDVTADGISLKTHVHGGVESGSSTTGVPQ